MKKSVEKGITLIALVVTIVVLLILAGISISMLTGENGVITQARKSKEATEQARVEELVSVAIGSVIVKNDGVVNGITPKMVADQINEDEKRSDVYAENETTFPTNIIFPKENRKAEANLNSKNTNDPNYSVSVDESDIAPVDLFDYEIIDNGETGALTLSSLPTKTVKITRVKPQYCNAEGFNPDTYMNDYIDTNYEIIYNGTKIKDKLIVPYQVDGKYVLNGVEGELYRIVEVNLRSDSSRGDSWPVVNKVIYPNTVKKIYANGAENGNYGFGGTRIVESFVLPVNLEEIGDNTFKFCSELTSMVIPENVTSIGDYAFYGCTGLTNVTMQNSVTNIGCGAFSKCNKLSNITLSNNLKSIKTYAFYGCEKLTQITIPDSVEVIKYYAFEECSGLTTITVGKNVASIGPDAFKYCSNLTTVNYRGTKEMWDNISIDAGNELLTNATINYNYTGE